MLLLAKQHTADIFLDFTAHKNVCETEGWLDTDRDYGRLRNGSVYTLCAEDCTRRRLRLVLPG